MSAMLAIVPDPWVADSKVISTGTNDGVLLDVSVEVPSAQGPAFTVRTLQLLGERINSAGWPHGIFTDPISVATMAANSLMLHSIPPGLPREEAIRLVEAADTQSQAVARDRAGWTFVPMMVGDVSYALWHRSLARGFIAHADLGDRVLAAWGAGDLPRTLLRMQLIELPS
jgi:hypothetical protein